MILRKNQNETCYINLFDFTCCVSYINLKRGENMRQETIVKTYLKFNELNEKQQEKILDKLQDINVDHESWYEHIYEYYESKLKKLGFYDIKFQWSGFSSQGDGASFSAKHKRGHVTTSGRYCHEYTMHCDDKAVLEVSRRIARRLYKSLQTDYDHFTSRDAIVEAIEANNYEFDSETLQIV